MSSSSYYNRRKLTHYEILGLQKNCTNEQIRASFVAMSKKYHPDRNSSDPSLHSKFVEINEAYSTLSKANSRQSYDLSIERGHKSRIIMQNGNPYDFSRNSSGFTWADDSIRPDMGRRQRQDSYYGIRGVSKKPNSWIVAGAFLFMGIGIVLHYLSFKYARTFTATRLDRQTEILSEHLSKIRRNAELNGNKFQVESLREKMANSQLGASKSK